MRVPASLGLVAFVVACSTLPVVGNGIVALQIQAPDSLTIRMGDSVALHAQALDASGVAVQGALITWATPDTTITVTTLGVVHAIDSIGTGRVQAVVGTLHSDLITFTLTKATSGTGSLRTR